MLTRLNQVLRPFLPGIQLEYVPGSLSSQVSRQNQSFKTPIFEYYGKAERISMPVIDRKANHRH
jgi:hypothetical protein